MFLIVTFFYNNSSYGKITYNILKITKNDIPNERSSKNEKLLARSYETKEAWFVYV